MGVELTSRVLCVAATPLLQAARTLLTLDAKDPKRVFEGEALLRRMLRYKLLPEDEKRLDFVLQLTTQKLLERRLQTLVRAAWPESWRDVASAWPL